MTWREKIEQQKAQLEEQRCKRTIHINLGSRAPVYRWLKEQAELNGVTLSTLAGMILEAAMEQAK